MSKMVAHGEYLDYPDESLERTAKPWNALLGAFLGEMAAYELAVCTAVRGGHVYNDSWTLTIGEEFVTGSAANNVPMQTVVTL